MVPIHQANIKITLIGVINMIKNNKCGIYKITNLINGLSYIGQAKILMYVGEIIKVIAIMAQIHLNAIHYIETFVNMD